jgi:hypothetical protein
MLQKLPWNKQYLCVYQPIVAVLLGAVVFKNNNCDSHWRRHNVIWLYMVNHSIKKTNVFLLRIRYVNIKQKKSKLSLGSFITYVDYQILTLFSGVHSVIWLDIKSLVDVSTFCNGIRTVHSWECGSVLFLIASLALDLQMVAHIQRSVALVYNHQLDLDYRFLSNTVVTIISGINTS